MRFVRASELKRGLRIGRPIFDKKGDLIFDRDQKLTDADIVKIRGLKIMGIFALEPAEPLPPFGSIEFELERQRFISTFALRDEMQSILVLHRAHKIDKIAESLISSFDGIKNRISFPQSVRSKDEYICAHSVNAAILTILISYRLALTGPDKRNAVYAALLHDIGKYAVPESVLEDESAEETERILFNAQDVGFELIGTLFDGDKKVMNTCIESHRILRNHRFERKPDVDKPTLLTKILVVADSFESMTSIDATGGSEPKSYPLALRHMRYYPEVYDIKVVEALEASIEILNPGATVMLNNGKQALVTALSGDDVLRPTVLELGTNRIINLEEQINRDLEIVDVVRKLDNRHVVDR
ncbi:MAG: HD domain-containing protein [Lachnospiraceae bacterium]|nr:HD domain-containing protein [Lachnospiraceae bacterium]